MGGNGKTKQECTRGVQRIHKQCRQTESRVANKRISERKSTGKNGLKHFAADVEALKLAGVDY